MMKLEHLAHAPGYPDYSRFLSAAVRLGDTLYLSGQTPRDPNGIMLEGDIETLTEQCLRNLDAVLKARGGSLADLAKLTVFLSDLDDFARVNAAFERILPDPKPARSCFQTARNPGDARIEIEGVALARD